MAPWQILMHHIRIIFKVVESRSPSLVDLEKEHCGRNHGYVLEWFWRFSNLLYAFYLFLSQPIYSFFKRSTLALPLTFIIFFSFFFFFFSYCSVFMACFSSFPRFQARRLSHEDLSWSFFMEKYLPLSFSTALTCSVSYLIYNLLPFLLCFLIILCFIIFWMMFHCLWKMHSSWEQNPSFMLFMFLLNIKSIASKM